MSRALPYCVAAPVALLVSLVAAQAHALTPLLPSGPPTLGTGPTPSPSVAPSAPAETNADVRTGTAPEQHFGDAGTRALDGVGNFAGRLVYNPVVISLEADSNTLSGHTKNNCLLMVK